MSKPVEQALAGLIPSLNGPLPSELLHVAVSLLAQSRSKASSLKPDEEIARTYACAHLACERLKQRLNLPPIVARPPIPPRAYRKVYGYFDSALTISSSYSSSSSSSRPPSAPQTPSRRARAAEAATAPSRTPRGAQTPASGRRLNAACAGEEDGVPGYVMPLIRQLCRALNAPAAVPHVYAGVRSVLKAPKEAAASPSRTRKRDAQRRDVGESQVEEQDVPALVVVVLFLAMIRLSGKETTGSEHQAMRTKAVKVLTKVEACDGKDEEDLSSAVERLLGDAKDRGWLEMEWLSNIVEGSGLKTNGGAVDEDDVEMEDARTPKRPAVGSANAYTPLKKRRTGENARDEHTSVSQGGLGTMMQDKVDYLSEARRAEFLRWKSSILKQIEQIEREGGLAMDISA